MFRESKSKNLQKHVQRQKVGCVVHSFQNTSNTNLLVNTSYVAECVGTWVFFVVQAKEQPSYQGWGLGFQVF